MQHNAPVHHGLQSLTVGLLASLMLTSAATAQGIAPPSPETVDARMETLHTPVPGSIFDLQPFRNSQTLTGADGTIYTLTSLNTGVNSWFVLEITPENGRSAAYHLENADAAVWQVSLTDAGGVPALSLDGGDDGAFTCAPWDGELDEGRSSGLPYAPLCDWTLFLRNKVTGNRTTREAVSDFLRNNIVFGNEIVNLIKGTFYEDAFMVSSEDLEAEEPVDGVDLLGTALLKQTPVMRPAMGFKVAGTEAGGMRAGSWYEVEGAPGIYASVMQPGMIAREVFQVPGANRLDGLESRADVYLVAFDMSQFDIGYELGTNHPSVGWSSRPRQRHRGAGPDGFARPDPLVMNGTLSPALFDSVAASFTGGFKRDHGAWRYREFATFNWGHHYGFMQNGVMLSRLWEDLATIYVTRDGKMRMETWTGEHEALLPDLVTARQNGVALIEDGVPGPKLTSRGDGNWSGDADALLRTLRAGACIREVDGRQFLIYAYFSTGTPSAMARTFQAYQCDYAMLLDMNSQELTYMALYIHGDDEVETQHLVSGMVLADVRGRRGTRIPRFISAPDNRDFFYLIRRN